MSKHIYFHITFWMIIAGINIGFTINFFPLDFIVFSTLFVLLFQSFVFYTNVYLIFPRFFSPSKMTKFIFISLIFVLLVALIQTLADYLVLSKLAPLRTHQNEFRMLLMSFIRIFFWLLFIDIFSTVFKMIDQIRKQAKHTQEITEEKLMTELKLLKAQINPHFLFNALNNIYSLSYMKSDKAPESILQLSQILRYVIEDCEKEKVKLSSEIEYIENYITFQKMKSPEKQSIEFDYSQVNQNIQLAPMMFIPFIENSFKYSNIEENKSNTFIKIKLSSKEDKVSFTIINSIPAKSAYKSGAGTGIKNVKQRLQIIYPTKHTLIINENNNEYKVDLTLETK
ncbi:MAG: histidine kinase [Calditrichaceae bacterium]|nr:histidine kinase [Calditrichaceae bacterium]MBN2708980.1 histidine kinase [Calditrichaceae bacterium]RQV93348.1 MAG: histidine kinase [Calditrichota bacterium]